MTSLAIANLPVLAAEEQRCLSVDVPGVSVASAGCPQSGRDQQPQDAEARSSASSSATSSATAGAGSNASGAPSATAGMPEAHAHNHPRARDGSRRGAGRPRAGRSGAASGGPGRSTVVRGSAPGADSPSSSRAAPTSAERGTGAATGRLKDRSIGHRPAPRRRHALPLPRAQPLTPISAARRLAWPVFALWIVAALVLSLAAIPVLARRRSEDYALAGLASVVGQVAARAKRQIKWRMLLEVATIVAIGLTLAFGIQAFLVTRVRVSSDSMVPTLRVGQHMLVDRVTPRFDQPDRGDIVVFNPPAGVIDNACGVGRRVGAACARPTTKRLKILFVKRVVAVPGDKLKVLGGRVYINGKRQREPEIRTSAGCRMCDLPREITIPPGQFFLMGDNRAHSVDSRFWGPVPRDWIIGRAFFTYWPPRRFGP